MLTDSQDQENQLKMSFFYFNKFNSDKLDKKAKTNSAKSLQSKLGRFTDTSQKQKTNRSTPVESGGGNNLGAMKSMFG